MVSAMHLLLGVLRWTATGAAVGAAVLAVLLWRRRPAAHGPAWSEPDDGVQPWDPYGRALV